MQQRRRRRNVGVVVFRAVCVVSKESISGSLNIIAATNNCWKLLCGLCRIKRKKAISYSQNVLLFIYFYMLLYHLVLFRWKSNAPPLCQMVSDPCCIIFISSCSYLCRKYHKYIIIWKQIQILVSGNDSYETDILQSYHLFVILYLQTWKDVHLVVSYYFGYNFRSLSHLFTTVPVNKIVCLGWGSQFLCTVNKSKYF
jgi:hypothetical protein